MSVFCLVQSLFTLDRVVRINSTYMILMRNPQDKLGVNNLFRQMFPGKLKAAMEAFDDATSEPRGYLLIDLHQLTEEPYRILTDIFQLSPIVYVAKE